MTSNKSSPDSLTDEQFCELLMGGAPETPTAPHAEADAFKRAVSSYRAESLLWAERRSAAMPSLLPSVRRSGFRAALPQWTLAAVAVMTMVAAGVHFNTASQDTAAVEAPAAIVRTADATATPEQIAHDNVLLGSIDAAVHAGSGLPVNALGLDAHAAVGADGSTE